MKLELLRKFCEYKSAEETARHFDISIDEFFAEIKQICDSIELSNKFTKKNQLIESKKTLVVFIDGASSNNPGPAGIGAVFMLDNQIIDTVSEYIGEKTNNEAEYIALIKALHVGLDYNIRSIKIFSDSELVVKQIKGLYNIKQEHLKKLNNEALSLIKEFEYFEINHITRNLNSQADKLAKSAIVRNDKQAHKKT
ncbi:MAG: ribonuclease HI family protein [Desulfurella sp.]|uniref:ribonuclease HI family protein n=1 Tax=Desulfurella sp. TaxID=1962857 RepID=UPI003C8BBCA5